VINEENCSLHALVNGHRQKVTHLQTTTAKIMNDDITYVAARQCQT